MLHPLARRLSSCIAITLAAGGCAGSAAAHVDPSESPASLQGGPRHAGSSDESGTATPSSAAEDGPPSSAEGRSPASAQAGGVEGRLAVVLAEHNRLRARHCAPPLTWSEPIARAAQSWANRLRDRSCAFEHSRNSPYGENLAFFSPPEAFTPEQVVSGWYDEVQVYDFAAPGFAMATGHFTQVVWASTSELGCGSARCGGGEIWVCNYGPPGNMQGQYEQNVKPTTCRR